MINFTPVYVVGFYTPESCGGFNWHRNAFDAGRAYEKELQGDSYALIYNDVVMVPSSYKAEEVDRYIDDMLDELEAKAIERGFPVKGEPDEEKKRDRAYIEPAI